MLSEPFNLYGIHQRSFVLFSTTKNQKKLQNNIGESQTTRGNLQLANSFGRFHGFVQNYHQVDSSMAR